MTDAMYGCHGCSTTLGRAGCAIHRDRPTVQVNVPDNAGELMRLIARHNAQMERCRAETLAAVRERVLRDFDAKPTLIRRFLAILDDLENTDRVPMPLNRKVNG